MLFFLNLLFIKQSWKQLSQFPQKHEAADNY